MKPYLTDSQFKELKKKIVILHQSNEQKNQHILEVWDRYGTRHEERALKTGDYCFKIEKCEELGFPIDTYFVDELCIERKNSVDELAGCMKSDAFRYEIRRMAKAKNAYLLVEDDSLTDIIEGNYRSQYNKDAFFRTLITWMNEHNIKILFLPKKYMAKTIAELCLATLKQHIFKVDKI